MTTSTRPALDGLRVLDLTIYTPGPFCTQILVDLGAAVIKIERPGSGDLERLSVPEYFHSYNRGKHSVVLDFKDAADRKRVLGLAAEADVVVESFRPGVVDRLGIGFEAVKAVNPDIVYCSVNGYGSVGPLAEERGHDTEYLARMGALALAPRGAHGEPQYESAFVVSDYAAGMYGVIGILTALARPELRPIHVEAPAAAAGLAWAYPKIIRRLEAPDPGETPGVGIFGTSDGGFVTTSAIEDHIYESMCRALGLDRLVRPDTATLALRRPHAAEINGALRTAIGRLTRDECVDRLRRGGASVAPVQSVEEVVADEEIAAWGLLHREPRLYMDLPLFGMPTVSSPHSPSLDEHGDAIRRDGWDAVLAVAR